jgi:hypothetical protein
MRGPPGLRWRTSRGRAEDETGGSACTVLPGAVDRGPGPDGVGQHLEHAPVPREWIRLGSSLGVDRSRQDARCPDGCAGAASSPLTPNARRRHPCRRRCTSEASASSAAPAARRIHPLRRSCISRKRQASSAAPAARPPSATKLHSRGVRGAQPRLPLETCFPRLSSSVRGGRDNGFAVRAGSAYRACQATSRAQRHASARWSRVAVHLRATSAQR